jgi:brefeldin A-inhibited guanine nucleotide-exchange protein
MNVICCCIGCGFRLPGESQKIDRFIDAFVKVYWQDNTGTEYCQFHHIDTVHLLSFALIMLNTDLHRASTEQGKKKRKKMTKDEFINNLRGIDQGRNIDRDHLSMMYDNIANSPIEMEVQSSESLSKEPHSPADNLRNVGDIMNAYDFFTR